MMKISDKSEIYIDNKSDTTVVFLHGWMCSIENYTYNLESIGNQYNVYAFNFIGHGKDAVDETDSSYYLKDYLRDLGIRLQRFDQQKIILIGHSMGAIVASIYFKNNKNVAKLILIDPPVNPQPAIALLFSKLLKKYPKVSQKILSKVMKSSLLKSIWSKWLILNDDESTEAASITKKGMELVTSKALLHGFYDIFSNNMLLNLDDIDNYDDIHVIYGEKDHMLNSEILHSYLEDGNIHEIKEAIHVPNRTRYSEFNSIIQSILR